MHQNSKTMRLENQRVKSIKVERRAEGEQEKEIGVHRKMVIKIVCDLQRNNNKSSIKLVKSNLTEWDSYIFCGTKQRREDAFS